MLGFILQQQSETGQWTLVQFCFLIPTGLRYTVVELELLAVAWAITKCKLFLSGLQRFQIIIDHNPLVPILNTQCLDEIDNPQLQYLCTRLMCLQFYSSVVQRKHKHST